MFFLCFHVGGCGWGGDLDVSLEYPWRIFLGRHFDGLPPIFQSAPL